MTEGIRIDPTSMAAIVNKAILDSLDDEARNVIIAQAIEHITKPTENPRGFGQAGPSVLKRAFDQAVAMEAEKIVREMIGENELVKQAIRDMLGSALDEAVKGDWHGLPEKIGDAFGSWLRDR